MRLELSKLLGDLREAFVHLSQCHAADGDGESDGGGGGEETCSQGEDQDQCADDPFVEDDLGDDPVLVADVFEGDVLGCGVGRGVAWIACH